MTFHRVVGGGGDGGGGVEIVQALCLTAARSYPNHSQHAWNKVSGDSRMDGDQSSGQSFQGHKMVRIKSNTNRRQVDDSS